MQIQCQTLFDITATETTGHVKPSRMPFTDHAGTRIANIESWDRSRYQQRNWETVTQLISLRTQINMLSMPIKINDLWQFKFEVDNENLFSTDADPLAILKEDCTGVPMLTGLNESVDNSVFLLPTKNIWFTIIPINIP